MNHPAALQGVQVFPVEEFMKLPPGQVRQEVALPEQVRQLALQSWQVLPLMKVPVAVQGEQVLAVVFR